MGTKSVIPTGIGMVTKIRPTLDQMETKTLQKLGNIIFLPFPFSVLRVPDE